MYSIGNNYEIEGLYGLYALKNKILERMKGLQNVQLVLGVRDWDQIRD